jgi:putative oxidoreductase
MANPVSERPAGNEADRRSLEPGPPAMHQPWTNLLRAFLGGAHRIDALERYGTLAARVLISQIFLISGFMKFLDWSGTEEQMAKQQMFWIPFFLVAAALVEIGGGLSLLLGYMTRPAALLLFLYLIPVTLTFHHFWSYPPEKQQEQMFFFLHNLALMGGLLWVMAWGPGPLSLDLKGRRSA